MNAEKLNHIQKSIRKNWGKVRPFKKIPQNNFNCYMFATCNTEPTEILTIEGTYVSTIGENVAYFGSIGQISGTKYKTVEQYKQAFINDLRILGILAEECFEDFIPSKDTIKIAFFSNFEEGMTEEDEEFHFLRFIPLQNRWMGKEGFSGGFQKIERGISIYKINVIGQKRLGIFKLKQI